MKNLKYIETHVHSTYSLLDGLIKIDDYIKYALENNQKALPITDHGSMSGVIDLYLKCKKNDLKIILGSEFYLTETMEDKINDNRHLILFAKNNKGYKNLVKLTTYANLENFYYKPRINYEILKTYKDDLICTSACIGSDINQAVLAKDTNKAENLILFYKDLFQDDFYIEFQNHFLEDQQICNEFLLNMSKKHDIKTLITNDAHYIKQSDSFSHDILLSKGKKLSDPKRFKFPNDQFYLKSTDEIYKTFFDYGDEFIETCIKNSHEMIGKCDVEIETGHHIMPHFPVPEGETERSYFKKKIIENFKKYYPVHTKEILNRLNYEMSVIMKMDFCGYFLIVQDYIKWAKDNNIPVGPARGSSAGSIVCRILGITEPNPLEYDLPFERFLNPDRVGLPDIDTDFCVERRYEIIDYLKNKYGENSVANICTFGELKPKNAFKTVSSTMEYPFSQANMISEMIQEKTIELSIESNPKLKEIYENNDQIKEMLDIAKTLEGNLSNMGTHAAGVIISNFDISDIVPLIKAKGEIVTAYTMNEIEKLGLVKYDILGLKALTVMNKCLSTIEENRKNKIDLTKVDFNDTNVYETLAKGYTDGVFQLESSGMKGLLKKLKPTELKHLDAILALFRPGPLNCGATENYVINKNDSSNIKYKEKKLEPILKDTYGVYIFQEQIMQIARDLAGYTMSESDELRKAMGKKIPEIIEQHEEKFISGCINNNINKEFAESLYKDITGFAEYCFPHGHSLSYSFISYRTAWLKVNYPIEYMTALLNSETSMDKINQYIGECFRLGINVLPPDINISTDKFEIDENNCIRFGFTSIKGIGEKSINPIIKERNKEGKFNSFLDFIKRVNIDKTTMECLLKIGAFNNVEKNSKYYYQFAEFISDAKKNLKNDSINLIEECYKIITNKNLKNKEEYKKLITLKKEITDTKKEDFKNNDAKLTLTKWKKQQKDIIDEEINKMFLDELSDVKVIYNCENFSYEEFKNSEKELMGFCISTHPVKIFAKYEKYFDFIPLEELINEENNKEYISSEEEITTIAIIKSIKEIKTKAGKKMAFIDIEYMGAMLSITLSPWYYPKIKGKIKEDDLILIKGVLSESSNKEYSKYKFSVETIRKLNFINIKDNFVIINITEKPENTLQNIRNILTDINKNDNINNINSDINYLVKVRSGNIVKTFKANMWINDKNLLIEQLGLNGIL